MTDVHILVIYRSKRVVIKWPNEEWWGGTHLLSEGEGIVIKEGHRANGCEPGG